MRQAYLYTTVCLLFVLFAEHGIAQPVAEKKDTAFRTVTGPSDFFKKSEPRKPDTSTTIAPQVAMVMPRINTYSLKPGNKEGMPPGLYAVFEPPLPDTVRVFEGGTSEFFTINTKAGKELIHGDSVSVFFEVDRRNTMYKGSPAKPVKKGKTNSMITRSGFIPSQGFGTNRYRFAVTPSHFILSPGALITASVHILGDQKTMGTILCSVTQIDFEKNTFYVETSNEVPEGEHINWVIINFPE